MQHQDKEAKYHYSPEQISNILQQDESTFIPLGVKEDGILLSGDLSVVAMKKEPQNRGLVYDLHRETLQVNGEKLAIESGLPNLMKDKCKEQLEIIIGKEPTKHLFSNNFYVQEIIKWNHALVSELYSKLSLKNPEENLLKIQDQTKDSYNLTVDESGKIFITCTQSGFKDKSDKPVVGPLESKFELTDKGFELVYLKTDDKQFDSLLQRYDTLLRFENEQRFDNWISNLNELENDLRMNPEKKGSRLFSKIENPLIKHISELKNTLIKNKPITQLDQTQLTELLKKITHIKSSMLDNNQMKLAGMDKTEIYEKFLWPIMKDITVLMHVRNTETLEKPEVEKETPLHQSKRKV